MEPTQANVISVDVLQRLRAAMVRCHEEMGLALSEADSEVDRAVVWVERERVMHWRSRIQRLGEEVNDARSALFRKETVTSSKDSRPSVVDEKKALERAKARLADAEQRLQRSRSWSVSLPRDQAVYKGGTAALSSMVERELPAAIAALERMSVALQAYQRGPAPDLAALLETAAEVQPSPGSMRRGGEPSTGAGGAP
ncbi:MAG: hypothetical protein EBQ99_02170 [Planctomycetes bacterium]|nr:hypothetical protein [Planctomycetota bacterium]